MSIPRRRLDIVRTRCAVHACTGWSRTLIAATQELVGQGSPRRVVRIRQLRHMSRRCSEIARLRVRFDRSTDPDDCKRSDMAAATGERVRRLSDPGVVAVRHRRIQFLQACFGVIEEQCDQLPQPLFGTRRAPAEVMQVRHDCLIQDRLSHALLRGQRHIPLLRAPAADTAAWNLIDPERHGLRSHAPNSRTL